MVLCDGNLRFFFFHLIWLQGIFQQHLDGLLIRHCHLDLG